MPTSYLTPIVPVMELVVLTQPKSLLDVGIGFGKYGFLAREYLELWDGRRFGENYCQWKRRIDGIEGYAPYITSMHRFIYSDIRSGNALDILPTIPDQEYDLLLLIDVLEHFDQAEGDLVLAASKRVARNVIICTPKDIEQGGQGNHTNKLETHKFLWGKKHLRADRNTFFVSNDHSLICYQGTKAVEVQKLYHKLRLKSDLNRYAPHLVDAYKAVRAFFLPEKRSKRWPPERRSGAGERP